MSRQEENTGLVNGLAWRTGLGSGDGSSSLEIEISGVCKVVYKTLNEKKVFASNFDLLLKTCFSWSFF